MLRVFGTVSQNMRSRDRQRSRERSTPEPELNRGQQPLSYSGIEVMHTSESTPPPSNVEASMVETINTRQPLYQAKGINKWYGPVHALTDVNLDIFPGEVLAMIGDNGAGKSTLINVLTGVMPYDSGQLLFNGAQIHLSSPHDARDLGIETVYQDLAIAPHLNAVANIYLGREVRRPGLLGKLGFLDQRRMDEEAALQISRLRVRVPNINRRMVTLSGGQRQGVAVARAVMWASKIVIMDEPTAALGVAQSGMVLDLIREVRNTGIPVVLISHNMPHVFEVADRIVVLRLGEIVAELDPHRNTIDDAVAAMTGSAQQRARGEVV
jgi:ABC-type sugar transport system ATPase subunit